MFCCNPTQWMSSVWYVCLRVFYFSLIFRIVVCVWCRWLSSCLFHVFVYVFFPFFSCVCCLSCSRAIRFLWNWFKRNSWVEDAYTANSWVFHSSRGTRTDSSASATIIRNGKYIGCSFVLERRLIQKSQNMPCTAYRSMSLLFYFHELLFFSSSFISRVACLSVFVSCISFLSISVLLDFWDCTRVWYIWVYLMPLLLLFSNLDVSSALFIPFAFWALPILKSTEYEKGKSKFDMHLQMRAFRISDFL